METASQMPVILPKDLALIATAMVALTNATPTATPTATLTDATSALASVRTATAIQSPMSANCLRVTATTMAKSTAVK